MTLDSGRRIVLRYSVELTGPRLHFPIFKAYQAAGRIPAATLDTLPARVLETERRLKGDSGDPDAALAALVLALARP